ncbi:prenyltransferase [Marinospirillum alkaliphilum]|uniref:1,4-dihydroxy-2-naphthoate octaprenyltransferase n=1 Tax=Marinospirillum alkaliphilum DSM 21637 TaxID=1122209 RepID=A0A1K1TVV6_9GAMM|nr:prenyltransferase [Marinospirillum alkaliphilum]SFX04594.1 1,4-dihydroxy-2-naphthoate octaprenyltransferase [Marinospirillum alkaliphilum DSM 21637]
MTETFDSPSAFHRIWSVDKYRFRAALRPFSLVVGVMSCSLGLVLGWQSAASPWLPALLALLASVLLQSGVNLINDYGDRDLVSERFGHLSLAQQQQISASIRLNFNYGLVAILLGVLLGLWLVWLSGPLLIWIGLVGVIGVFCYSQPPVDFKRRGLGALAVFLLMGLLMVQGGYYVMAGQLSLDVLWLSLPLSLLVALLLLANELRDFELDRLEGQRTLTVRLGYQRVSQLYRLLLLTVFALPLLLWWQGLAPGIWLTLLALPLITHPLQLLQADAAARKPLTPLTGRLLAGFGLLQVIGHLVFAVS